MIGFLPLLLLLGTPIPIPSGRRRAREEERDERYISMYRTKIPEIGKKLDYSIKKCGPKGILLTHNALMLDAF